MKGSLFVIGVFRQVVTASIVITLLSLLIVPTHKASAADATSYVRVIHASPYVGAADVFVDGTALLSSFEFASITDYVPLPSGIHKVQIALVGKGISASVLTQDLPVLAGYSYTVAALGATPDTLSFKVFQDDNHIVANRAQARVYHLAPNAGDVTVDVGGGDYSLKNLSYPSASSTVTEDVGACTFTLSDPLFGMTLPLTANLQPNTITSVFAVGLFNGNPKIQLISAQSKGLPGLPNTGSDPGSSTGTIEPLPIYGGLAICVSILLCINLLARRLKRSV